jgi:hypothetical protein
MLDDKVWQVLAEMPAPEALAATGEAADALDKPGAHVRNINALFMVRRCELDVKDTGSAVAFGGLGVGDPCSQAAVRHACNG